MRYYVSNRLIAGGTDPSGWRLSAPNLEKQIATILADHIEAQANNYTLTKSPDAHQAKPPQKCAATQIMSQDFDGRTEEAWQLMHRGSYGDAVLILNELLNEEHPLLWNIYYLLGLCHRWLNDFRNSISALKMSNQLCPGTGPVLLALGISYQLAGEFDKSIKSLKEAIGLENNYFQALNSLGLTYKKMGRMDDALAEYYKAQEALIDEFYQKAKDDNLVTSEVTEDGDKVLLLGQNYFPETEAFLKSDLRYSTVMNNIAMVLHSCGNYEVAKDAYLEAISPMSGMATLLRLVR